MEISDNKQPQAMRDGTETKPLYIKHLSRGDWEILEQLQMANQMDTKADVVRWAIRRAAGRI